MSYNYKLIETLSTGDDSVWNVCWNNSGTILGSCGTDIIIRLWQKEEKQWVKKASLDGGHKRTIRCISWSPCDQYLASASFDGITCIWSKKSGENYEVKTVLEGHSNEVKSVSWSRSGNFIATCSRDKSVWIWETEGDEEFEDYECVCVLSSHTQDVKQVTWHPNQDILASCSYDNLIIMFKEDADDWSSFATLASHTSSVWSICYDKTGTRLASCSDDRTVKIWQEYLPGNSQGVITTGNNATWKCVCTLSGYHNRPIYSISWCHQTDLIATACGDDTVRIFKENPATGDIHEPSFELVISIENAHTQDVNSVVWNPKEPGLLASCSDDGDVKLWQILYQQL